MGDSVHKPSANYAKNLRRNITEKLPKTNPDPVQSPSSPGAKIVRLKARFDRILSR
jgi:hypothetical protein